MKNKTKPLILVVYCGKAWVLNRMANLIASVLSGKYDCIVSYSGALASEYGGNPEFFKKLPIDGYCNLVAMDSVLENILNGNEVVVSTIHHWTDEDYYKSLEKNFIKSNQIITVSNQWKEKLIEKNITIPIETIPAFVDCKFFQKEKVKKSKKITIGMFFMIHSNEENDRKGVRHIIALSKYIKEQNLNTKIKFLISGGGWEKTIKEIEKNNIEIEYQKGLEDDEMPKMYQMLDFYLMLSDIEGGPFSVMEAMASRVPVVSTNIGVVRDIGIDKENIIIVNSQNPEQILNSIMYYHNNKIEREKLLENAYKVAENHKPEKVYSKYIEIFDRLIDKTKVKYDNALDLDEVQKFCNKFGNSIIKNKKITSIKKKNLIKTFKPFLKLLKSITPVKSLRNKIKSLYK